MSAGTANLAAVIDRTTALLAGVRPEQRALPTPCPDYDVSALTNHLVGWLRMFAARAAGTDDHDDPNAYQCGAHPAAEFAAAGAQAVAAFRSGAADRPLRMASSELPGSMVLGMMLVEYIGHGWDLAIATGQPVPYAESDAQAALEAARGMLMPAYRGPGKTFGYEVEVSADAAAVDRLVAFIGRSPDAVRDGR
ncbi:TIGR03086 family metal-binding protein [Micromonospora sp. RTP1Z1]|uniref:TIGR03086 family metal-binding protein n=1 Tax=Micromonospora sp. RTP1Z1 TaxID=2994043 RepID=UPI0029C6FC52|nr:TIGR03086 family metal-binding protein [Micromonospora sp. RTP1Z1]